MEIQPLFPSLNDLEKKIEHILNDLHHNTKRLKTCREYFMKIQPLFPSLNGLEKKIEHILNDLHHNTKELKTCREYIPNIKSDLSERDYFFKNYKILTQNNNNDTSQFLSKNKLDHSIINCQLLMSLLILNTRIYERCTILCYLLHNPKIKSLQRISVSELLFLDKNHYFNKETNKKYSELIKKLKDKFGYYLAVIIFLRNQLSHKGNNLDLDKTNIPIFNVNKSTSDYLKLQSVEKIHNIIVKEYELKQNSPEHLNFLNENSKHFDIILERSMLMSDTLFGHLMHEIIQKHSKKS